MDFKIINTVSLLILRAHNKKTERKWFKIYTISYHSKTDLITHRSDFCSTFQEPSPPKIISKLGHIYSVMLHGYLEYMVLQLKGFGTEFLAIFSTVNPSGKCNCKLCSAQLRVKMRSAWEAVRLGTFTYNTGCIFNARKGLTGSRRHEGLKYQN